MEAGRVEGITSATCDQKEEVTGTTYTRTLHINPIDNLPLLTPYSFTATAPASTRNDE